MVNTSDYLYLNKEINFIKTFENVRARCLTKAQE